MMRRSAQSKVNDDQHALHTIHHLAKESLTADCGPTEHVVNILKYPYSLQKVDKVKPELAAGTVTYATHKGEIHINSHIRKIVLRNV